MTEIEFIKKVNELSDGLEEFSKAEFKQIVRRRRATMRKEKRRLSGFSDDLGGAYHHD